MLLNVDAGAIEKRWRRWAKSEGLKPARRDNAWYAECPTGYLVVNAWPTVW